MKGKWTEHELRFLANFYPAKGAEWCADRLGRSIQAVESKARRSGILKNRRWTPDEDTIVVLHATTGVSVKSTARVLGRTYNSIANRRGHLRKAGVDMERGFNG